MDTAIQEFIETLNENNGAGNDFIEFLKEKYNINFYDLDKSAQHYLVLGFNAGYCAGQNFTIEIKVTGPREDQNVDFQATVDPHFFEGLLKKN